MDTQLALSESLPQQSRCLHPPPFCRVRSVIIKQVIGDGTLEADLPVLELKLAKRPRFMCGYR
jgi:hypothetical protein